MSLAPSPTSRPLGPPDDALAAALGAHARDPELAPLASMPTATRAALAALVGEARERQRREVRAAIDEALTHVPAVLRVAVRKLLFG